MTADWQVLVGDVREMLRTLPDESVQCVVTSPPYWGLRDYGTGQWEGGDAECDHRKVSDALAAVATSTLGGGKKTTGHLQEGYGQECGKCGARRIDNQIGLEATPDEFVQTMVDVFREVRRVLRPDGTLWLNLGDSYSAANFTGGGPNARAGNTKRITGISRKVPDGMKPKDLVGIPWRVAFALQADGWWLRSDIIWSKLNPMPESVTDRPTKAHEYIFLLTKAATYFYDADAVREPLTHEPREREFGRKDAQAHNVAALTGNMRPGVTWADNPAGRNKRTVWTVATQPYSEAHFATFPPKLIEPCILAGTSERGCCAECGAPWERVVERVRPDLSQFAHRNTSKHDPGMMRSDAEYAAGRLSGQEWNRLSSNETKGWQPTCTHTDAPTVPCTVLDPFSGAGTTGLVALQHGRSYVGVELNEEYAEMSRRRILGTQLRMPLELSA